MTDMTANEAGVERGRDIAIGGRQPPAPRAAGIIAGDSVFRFVLWACGLLVLALLGAIIILLFQGGLQALINFGVEFFWSTRWNPVTQKYGAGVMIYGTLVTSIVALVVAVPMS